MADRSVYRRYFPYPLTVPAGTPEATPVEFTLPVFESVLEAVDVLIPSGHAARTGLAFSYAGERVLPWGDPTSWVQGDNQTLTLPIDLQVSGTVLGLGFNAGNYDHTFYVRLLLRYLDAQQRSSAAPLALVV